MPHLVRKVGEQTPAEITCGIIRKLTAEEDFRDMDIAHITITDSTKKHYHKKLTEVYYVLKGSVDVEIDGKIEYLKEVSLIMIKSNTDHKAWKTSKEGAEILVVCSPPWRKEDEILV